MSVNVKQHDWGPVKHAPDMDGRQCRRCGLVASNTQIAARWYTNDFEKCEAAK